MTLGVSAGHLFGVTPEPPDWVTTVSAYLLKALVSGISILSVNRGVTMGRHFINTSNSDLHYSRDLRRCFVLLSTCVKNKAKGVFL